jgi:hypothetical protein
MTDAFACVRQVGREPRLGEYLVRLPLMMQARRGHRNR